MKRILLLWLLALSSVVWCSGPLFAGTSHLVTGTVKNSDGSTPGNSDLAFTAYISTRTAEKITVPPTTGAAGYDSGTFYLNTGNFATDWAVGNTLVIEFVNAANSESKTVNVTLTAAGTDIVPETTLIPKLITVTAGTGQSGTVGTILATAFSVKLTTGDTPNAGVAVTFTAPTGDKFGASTTQTVNTNASGVATSSKLTLGTVAGTRNVTVSATGYASKTISYTANPGSAKTITKTSGDAQTGTAGQQLGADFVVTVKDTNGNTVADGTDVTFTVASGGGSLSSSVVDTVSGQAATRLTLGTTAGANTVTAAATGATTVTFTATGNAGAATKILLVPQFPQVSSSLAVPVTLTATVADQYNNKVASATNEVTFTVDATTYGDFGGSASIADAAEAGVATALLTTKATGGGPNIISLEAAATGLTTDTATLQTVPFGLDRNTVNLLVTEFYNFTLTGGSNPTWALTAPAKGTLSGKTVTGAKYTAGASTGTDTLTVSDTIEGSPVSSTATINLYKPLTTSVKTATGMTTGSTLQLVTTEGDGSYTYASSDESLATVNDSGLITANSSANTGTFTVTTGDGLTYQGTTTTNTVSTATIEVVKPLAYTSDAEVFLDTKVNKTSTIVMDTTTGTGSFTYTTGNSGIATVSSSGVITAVGAGSTTITIKDAKYSNITTTVAVTVSAPLGFKVNGTTVTGPLTVASGGSLTLTPSGGTGAFSLTASGEATITDNGDGTWVFTPPTTGAFAKNYTVTLTDEESGLTDQITITVPLKIETTATNILTADATQTVTVTGAAAGDEVTFKVLDAKDVEDLAGAIATIVGTPPAVVEDVPNGNPVEVTIDPADGMAEITPFTVQASDVTNSELAAVSTGTLNIIPMASYSGVIVDGAAAPVVGALIVANNISNAEGSPYQTTSGADGSFAIQLPLRKSGHYTFTVSATGFVPGQMNGTSYFGGGNLTTFALAAKTASVGGTVNCGDATPCQSATVYACKADGTCTDPVKAADDVGTYTLYLSGYDYTKVFAQADGYVAGNVAIALSAEAADLTGVDLTLAAAVATERGVPVSLVDGFVMSETVDGKSITVSLPPGASTTTDVYINVELADDPEGSVKGVGSFGQVVVITLLDGAGNPVDAALLKDLEITVPFDTSLVAPGDFERGAYRIFYADDLDKFKNTTTAVPVADIVMVDDINGLVTFRVNHLTVFGVGAAAPSGDGGSSGCFIATAAYGSYEAPYVKLLRTFRDRYLLTSGPGTWFVKQYYTYSPAFADWLRQHDSARAVVRVLLLPLIGMSWVLIEASLFAKLLLGLAMLTAAGLVSARMLRRDIHREAAVQG